MLKTRQLDVMWLDECEKSLWTHRHHNSTLLRGHEDKRACDCAGTHVWVSTRMNAQNFWRLVEQVSPSEECTRLYTSHLRTRTHPHATPTTADLEVNRPRLNHVLHQPPSPSPSLSSHEQPEAYNHHAQRAELQQPLSRLVRRLWKDHTPPRELVLWVWEPACLWVITQHRGGGQDSPGAPAVPSGSEHSRNQGAGKGADQDP